MCFVEKRAEGQKECVLLHLSECWQLKDKEVNAAHDQLVAALTEKLTATIRDTQRISWI